eukprot:gene1722-3335_t
MSIPAAPLERIEPPYVTSHRRRSTITPAAIALNIPAVAINAEGVPALEGVITSEVPALPPTPTEIFPNVSTTADQITDPSDISVPIIIPVDRPVSIPLEGAVDIAPVPDDSRRNPCHSVAHYEPDRFSKVRHSHAAEGGVSDRLSDEVQHDMELRKVTMRKFDNPTYTQAQSREDWLKWEEAINSEMEQLYTEGVFNREQHIYYRNLPKGHELLGTMFTLVIKRNPTTGDIDKYKARLVVLGNQQTEHSYDEIKSMTARGSSAKLLMAIQAKTNAHSMVLDVKGVYLKSKINDLDKEKIYLKLPDGRIVQLLKYLYSLKQAGREWQINLTRTLLNAGFTNSTVEPLVFSKFNAYDEVTRKEGNLVSYPRLSVQHDQRSGSVTISQPAYIEKMLAIANMRECKGTPTPMVPNQGSNNVSSNIQVDKTNYLRLVGLINYLASYSRPDLLYSLSRIAQAYSSPTEADLKRVHRILRYISFTKEKGLIFKRDNNISLVCYVDASHNSYPDGKGHFGYSISLGKGSGTFYAKSSKLRINALSST